MASGSNRQPPRNATSIGFGYDFRPLHSASYPKRRPMPHSKGNIIVILRRTLLFHPSRRSIAIVSTGASVATGPVKLVKLANAPSAPFPPWPKVDEKLPCGQPGDPVHPYAHLLTGDAMNPHQAKNQAPRTKFQEPDSQFAWYNLVLGVWF